MGFAIVVSADESTAAEVRELGDDEPVREQVRRMIGDVVEVVRARWLHEMAPRLWPVLVVDEDGFAKGLPLNRRAGGLYGGEIAGDALIVQERRSAFDTAPLSGFGQAEAEQLQAAIGE